MRRRNLVSYDDVPSAVQTSDQCRIVLVNRPSSDCESLNGALVVFQQPETASSQSGCVHEHTRPTLVGQFHLYIDLPKQPRLRHVRSHPTRSFVEVSCTFCARHGGGAMDGVCKFCFGAEVRRPVLARSAPLLKELRALVPQRRPSWPFSLPYRDFRPGSCPPPPCIVAVISRTAVVTQAATMYHPLTTTVG